MVSGIIKLEANLGRTVGFGRPCRMVDKGFSRPMKMHFGAQMMILKKFVEDGMKLQSLSK